MLHETANFKSVLGGAVLWTQVYYSYPALHRFCFRMTECISVLVVIKKSTYDRYMDVTPTNGACVFYDISPGLSMGIVSRLESNRPSASLKQVRGDLFGGLELIVLNNAVIYP
jgi:hypothetical protein